MPTTDYARIEQAIRYLEANFRDQPSLAQIAASVNLSEYHFQRLFRRWAGVTPKRFLQYMTADFAAKRLRESKDLLDTSLEAGLSGTGRLHDLFVNLHAVTPGELKRRGEDLTIRYGVHASPFGDCLLALTQRGICALSFLTTDAAGAVAELRADWPQARLRQDQTTTQMIARQIFSPEHNDGQITLHVKGTNFQIKVWEALMRIAPGAMVSYQDLATELAMPKAARAVGSAVAKNPVGYLIPCHRVIQKTGAFGGYRWGNTRKKAILGWEAGRAESKAKD